MAKNTKCSKKGLEQVSCSFNFDGVIKSDVRGCVIVEILKYLLYERQQIPLTFDNIKRDLCKHNLNERADGNVMGTGQNGKRLNNVVKVLEYKKVAKTIEEMETLFSYISKSFEQHPEIKQILFVLGSTVVSPKESFLITLPNICPESDGLTKKSCITSLLKQLIMQDIVNHWKSISCTNLQFLIKAHRNCGITWFTPRPNFKPPQRGRHCAIKLETSEKHMELGSHDLTCDDVEVEISGIEPFDISGLSNLSLESSSAEIDTCEEMTSCSTLNLSSSDQRTCSSLKLEKQNDFCVEEDHIWFQAPIKIKGYKAKHKGIHF